MAEVLWEVTALVLVLALLAVIVLAGVIVWRRKPGKVVEIRPRQVVKGDVVESRSPVGDPMTQLVQLMAIEKIENMKRKGEPTMNEKELAEIEARIDPLYRGEMNGEWVEDTDQNGD